MNGGVNTYTYVGGNPVMKVDPLGLYQEVGDFWGDYFWGPITDLYGGPERTSFVIQTFYNMSWGFLDGVSFNGTRVGRELLIGDCADPNSYTYQLGDKASLVLGLSGAAKKGFSIYTKKQKAKKWRSNSST